MKKIALLILLSCLSVLLIGYLNFQFLWPFLIPDDCYYHAHQPNWVVGLLYNFPQSENGHSVPSVLNILLTLFIGIFIAYKLTNTIYKAKLF